MAPMDVNAALLDDLEARSLVHQVTDVEALRERLAAESLALYYGCDPSAPSLHVGNLIGLVLLRRFRDAGHRPIALAGGATGMIGDPSGRSEERNLLDEEELTANVAAIKAQMVQIVGDDVELVDNRTWTEPATLIEFLRDVGKHATVNQMLARESVKARLASERGISFAEFSYMLIQANDYRWLFDHRAVELQVGGSDQWGNMLAGVDLIRRSRGASVHALSWPLLTGPDGTKLGKTTGARVWLSAELTSPYAFFQHWLNVSDDEVGILLRQLTLAPVDDIDAVLAEHAGRPDRRVAQRRLARDVTALVHGPEAAATAEAAAGVVFSQETGNADETTLAALVDEIPTVRLARARFQAGYDPVDLLVDCGLANSKGDARRTLAQGGAYLDSEPLDPTRRVDTSALRFGRYVLVRKGKRRYALGVADQP